MPELRDFAELVILLCVALLAVFILGGDAELIKAFGVLFSGLLAAYTFWKLQKVRAADADYKRRVLEGEKLAVGNERSRNELLSQQPVLSIKLRIRALPLPHGQHHSTLGVTARLKNNGQQNLKVFFDDFALTVSRVTVAESDEAAPPQDIHFRRPEYFVQGNRKPTPYRIFRVGQDRQMVFTVPVPAPGLYIAEFQARYATIPFIGIDDLSESSESLILAYEQATCVVP